MKGNKNCFLNMWWFICMMVKILDIWNGKEKVDGLVLEKLLIELLFVIIKMVGENLLKWCLSCLVGISKFWCGFIVGNMLIIKLCNVWKIWF